MGLKLLPEAALGKAQGEEEKGFSDGYRPGSCFLWVSL